MKRKKLLYLIISITILIFLSIFLHYQNNALVVTKHELQYANLPKDFDSFTIVHLSDLHNKSFGPNQEKLIAKVKAANPDIVVFTGDIVDSRRYDADPSITLMEQLVSFTSVYYVPGNHEMRSGEFSELEEQLRVAGVNVLRNEMTLFSRGNDTIAIIGVDDPTFDQHAYSDSATLYSYFEEMVEQNNVDDYFNLVLSHRPEEFALYADYHFDLVFTGHAHGGQIRLPFTDGIIAPHQGLFPKYTSGTHQKDETTMVVSRGLGNSLFPFRIFNRPEIVVVTLEKKGSLSNSISD